MFDSRTIAIDLEMSRVAASSNSSVRGTELIGICSYPPVRHAGGWYGLFHINGFYFWQD